MPDIRWKSEKPNEKIDFGPKNNPFTKIPS